MASTGPPPTPFFKSNICEQKKKKNFFFLQYWESEPGPLYLLYKHSYCWVIVWEKEYY